MQIFFAGKLIFKSLCRFFRPGRPRVNTLFYFFTLFLQSYESFLFRLFARSYYQPKKINIFKIKKNFKNQLLWRRVI